MAMFAVPWSEKAASGSRLLPRGARDKASSKGSRQNSAISNVLCKSNRSQDKFLYKVWRVLENSPQLRLRIAGPFMDKSLSAPEDLVTNQQLFLDRSGRWNLDLKSNAEEGIKVPATLDFPASIVPLLPEQDRAWKYGTCALVGNSGSLLASQYGAQIDSREAVFRVNSAPTLGFEDRVGARTTFDLINQQHTKALAEVEGRSGALPKSQVEQRNSTLVVFEVGNNFARRHLYVALLKKMKEENRDAVVLSPAMTVQVHRAWLRFGQALEAANLYSARKMLKPMSGMSALMFAIQVCEHVHLYGMSPYKGDGGTPYHYFDDISGVTKHHAFDAAFEVFKQISKW
eukprot:CAMPEP_0114261176 /NCGR_PEP_ID=MMETSP0058-20121206/20964_1 /TAXON_ID=36894 /ORGANISM="Pyramimonas parkeae, CCMP726" /LENGTH=343 /DNA_ID=CAMNT_0001376627 /DNA_START=187 /DNA_END=1215 /DNA_ORIENTATION=-